MEERSKKTLYNEINDADNKFINNSNGLAFGSTKVISINSINLNSGALSSVNGMLSNDTSVVNQDVNIQANNINLQPASPESAQESYGVPSYGVPVEPTVAVTPNMFENPLDSVYNEAKNFMDSEKNSTGFTSTEIESQLNVNPSIDNSVPVMAQTAMPEVKEEVVSPINTVEMPVQPTSVAEPSVPQTPVMNDVVAPVSMPIAESITMTSEPVVNDTAESVTSVIEEQAPVNTSNELLVKDTVSPTNSLIDTIKTVKPLSEVEESEVDIKNEIDEVIEAINNAREKLINLKEKMSKKENEETKTEAPVNMVSSEVPVVPEVATTLESPAIQETPVVPITPNIQPMAQNNMLDINSFFGKAA